MKNIIEYPKLTEFKGFIKEWNESQFRAMNLAIRTHFGRKGATTLHHGHVCYSTFKEWDNCFGLAYTSSSSYAMYSVCNTYIYFDAERKYHYHHFAIGKDGYYYAVLWDKEENELIIKL